jgi:hypothetical protein
MGTRQDSSLIGLAGRIQPPSGPRNHHNTVHKAMMVGGEGTPVSFAQGTVWDILTFTMDAPIIWEVELSFSSIDAPDPPGAFQWIQYIALMGDLDTVANTIFVADPPKVSVLTQGRGLTVTNHVPVKGYWGYTFIPNFGLESESSPAQCSASIKMWCQGGQMYGTPTMGLAQAKNQYLGCGYLLESLYSQAIYDAGNKIIDPVSGGYMDVVGLYASAMG